jgi:hypothetical protein
MPKMSLRSFSSFTKRLALDHREHRWQYEAKAPGLRRRLLFSQPEIKIAIGLIRVLRNWPLWQRCSDLMVAIATIQRS